MSAFGALEIIPEGIDIKSNDIQEILNKSKMICSVDIKKCDQK